MRLWNTLTRQKETFTADKLVRIYVCGITPYDTTHLGHARTYLLFDLLIRELERLGHSVRYVQNVTDVDDPLYERARETGKSSSEIATWFTRIFQDDMAALGVRPPDFYPRASGEVAEMQRLIAALLERGMAYQRGDYVYYRAQRFPHYGELGRLDRMQMIAAEREIGEDPSDPRKEDALDFILWKPSAPDEDAWPSPWGPGRPGWHIECSAMALRYLGPKLDIHGGGTDLIFPHHENEIAQSEPVTRRSPFARFWIHVEMVRLQGIKMSKSLGNLVLVRDLLPRFGPLAIRYYLLSTHYRDPLDFSQDNLHVAAERAGQLVAALAKTESGIDASFVSALQCRFDKALADDLDTPSAFDALDALSQALLANPAGTGSRMPVAALYSMASRLGLTGPMILGSKALDNKSHA